MDSAGRSRETEVVIGLESSTTATKALAVDARGRLAAMGFASLTLSSPQPGWSNRTLKNGGTLHVEPWGT
jgi:sugar (pentulose or hexulose) kinase